MRISDWSSDVCSSDLIKDEKGQPILKDDGKPMTLRDANQEQAFGPIYSYAAITDSVEGLILVNVETFADGEFRNNGLKRAVTWNPDHVLDGARHKIGRANV